MPMSFVILIDWIVVCFVITHALSKVLNDVLIGEYLKIKLKTEKKQRLFASTLPNMFLCLLVIKTGVLKHFGVLTKTSCNVPS